MTKNQPLLVALSLPIILVLVVLASIYVPRGSVSPGLDFIYQVGIDYYSPVTFKVINGKLTRIVDENVHISNAMQEVKPKLYLHDVKSDVCREVSFLEAENFTYDSNPISADGYSVVEGSSGGGFLLFSSPGNYGKFFIKKNSGGSKPLNLQVTKENSYYYDFLGWVKE